MKLFFKIMFAALACVGLAQAATIPVTMIKLDPAARKKTWAYDIRTKKTESSTVHTARGTFTRDKKISINPDNYETVIRVYTNSNRAFGTGGEINYRELIIVPTKRLNESLNRDPKLSSIVGIENLKNKSNGLAVSETGSIGVIPIAEINKLVTAAGATATPTIPTRKIKVIKGEGGTSDEWSLQSLDEAGNQINEVSLRSRSAGARTLAIPKDGAFSILVTKVTDKTTKKGTLLNKLRFTQEEAKDLKELVLDNKGMKEAGLSEF